MNENRVGPPGPGLRRPLPPSKPWNPQGSVIPTWVWLLAAFCVTLFGATAFFRYRQKAETTDGAARIWGDEHRKAEEKKAKAAELAREGFEMLRQQTRNHYYARCREDGNYPLLFIDKIVCVKPDAIAWVKYDGNPEQDTSQGGERAQ